MKRSVEPPGGRGGKVRHHPWESETLAGHSCKSGSQPMKWKSEKRLLSFRGKNALPSKNPACRYGFTVAKCVADNSLRFAEEGPLSEARIAQGKRKRAVVLGRGAGGVFRRKSVPCKEESNVKGERTTFVFSEGRGNKWSLVPLEKKGRA